MEKGADAFRTISEVAEDLDLPQHVLRFWEMRFTQIKPMKRSGGRRFYRPDDVDLLRGIKHLLYGDGYTIKGVQRILKEQGARYVVAIGRGDPTPMPVMRKGSGPGSGPGPAQPDEAGSNAIHGNAAHPGMTDPAMTDQRTAESHVADDDEDSVRDGSPSGDGPAALRRGDVRHGDSRLDDLRLDDSRLDDSHYAEAREGGPQRVAPQHSATRPPFSHSPFEHARGHETPPREALPVGSSYGASSPEFAVPRDGPSDWAPLPPPPPPPGMRSMSAMTGPASTSFGFNNSQTRILRAALTEIVDCVRLLTSSRDR